MWHTRPVLHMQTTFRCITKQLISNKAITGTAAKMASAGKAASGPSGAPTEASTIIDLCTSHWKQQAVRAVVKLGVMDAPGLCVDAATPISTLAAHTQCNEEHLYRLLRYVAQLGLFEELPDQHFKLTPLGQHLRTDHPSQLWNAAVTFGEPGHYMPWMYLDKAVKEGKSAFDFWQPSLSGPFEYFSQPENKQEEEGFNRLMTTFTKSMDKATTLHDFGGYRVVADIGGGYGQLVMNIMEAYPGVQKGVVLELPFVVDSLPPVPDKFKQKITWVKGDMFDSVPVSADCYVMKSIMHDWPDAHCLTILSNLRAAMPAGSTLVNFDRLMPDNMTGPHPAKAMDINMLAMCNGKERTKEQWHELFGKAGFTIQKIVEAPTMAAIVAVPS